MPALTVVLPVYVLVLPSVVVPLPVFVSEPVPEIVLGTLRLSERLKTNVLLLVMLPVPKLPLLPPLALDEAL